MGNSRDVSRHERKDGQTLEVPVAGLGDDEIESEKEYRNNYDIDNIHQIF
jgi:hypothetical protein